MLIQNQLYAQADLVYGGPLGTSQARTPHTVNLQTHFGALPNDGIDDSYALIKASRYIANLWHANGDTLVANAIPNINYTLEYARLEIPSGVYNVGEEINIMDPNSPFHPLFVNSATNLGTTNTLKFSDYYGSGNNTLGIPIDIKFDVCTQMYRSKNYLTMPLLGFGNYDINPINPINGVEIIGVGPTKPLFKYADDIHVGYMDAMGNASQYTAVQANPPNAYTCQTQWELYHSAPILISIDYCKNIKISNIEIDGSLETAYIMGPGLDGYQGEVDGVALNAKNIS